MYVCVCIWEGDVCGCICKHVDVCVCAREYTQIRLGFPSQTWYYMHARSHLVAVVFEEAASCYPEPHVLSHAPVHGVDRPWRPVLIDLLSLSFSGACGRDRDVLTNCRHFLLLQYYFIRVIGIRSGQVH